MCVGKLAHALYIGPGMGNQRNGKNPHQGPVAVVHNGLPATMERGNSPAIPLDRLAGCPAHVENFIIRGKYPMNQPRRRLCKAMYGPQDQMMSIRTRAMAAKVASTARENSKNPALTFLLWTMVWDCGTSLALRKAVTTGL